MILPRRFARLVVAVGVFAGGTSVAAGQLSSVPAPESESVAVHADTGEVTVDGENFELSDLEPWTETGDDSPERWVLAAWAFDENPTEDQLAEITNQSSTSTTEPGPESEVVDLGPVTGLSTTTPVPSSNHDKVDPAPALPPSNVPHTPEHDHSVEGSPGHDHSVEQVPWREEIFDTAPPTDLVTAVARYEEAKEMADEAAADLEAQEGVVEVAEGMVDTLDRRVALRRDVLELAKDSATEVATGLYVRGDTSTDPLSELDVSTDPLVTDHMSDLALDNAAERVGSATEGLSLAEKQEQVAHAVLEWAVDKREDTLAVLEEAEAGLAEAEQARAEALTEMTRGTGQLAAVPAVVGPAIKVDVNVAPALASLIEAARADGIPLGGWGWRSPERTAELRITNGCPDVFESPPSSCRVPTARPGTSMHEQGLAIDFTCNESTVSRGTVCDAWLLENGPKYGLINLDSEAWHYSTTGR